jgi:hypothetical protein
MDLHFKARILHHMLRSAYEEWRDTIWKRDLDGQYCCDGRECCCGGETLREMWTWHLPAPKTDGTPF